MITVRPFSFAISIAALLLAVAAAPVKADTLFLKNGKTLKIHALECDASVCVASLPGGDVDVRAIDVARVEPDEEVDPEPVVEPVPNTVELTAARTVDQLVTAAANKYALPRSLVRAVAKTESSFNPKAVSTKGAQGIMQLMPGTAKDLGVRDAFDAAENIDAGAKLLRQLLEKYDGRVAEALAAYNAGAGAVARHKGVPPYPETRNYIRKVVKDFEKGEPVRPTSTKKP